MHDLGEVTEVSTQSFIETMVLMITKKTSSVMKEYNTTLEISISV